ncbi:MAG: hypothetical protein V1792_04615 [Pseudomonadota bacterium]
MNWQDAFLVQAWSDYQIFQAMNESRYPVCHKLHYLQMATEKLAKGCLCEITGNSPPQKTHFAFVRFLRYTKSHPLGKKRLGFAQKKQAYSAYVDSLIPTAYKIERLAPAGGGFSDVNPEYPWSRHDGNISCPVEYDFPEFKRHELGRIKKLLTDLFWIIGFK